jgi:hypothetical protein
MIFCTIPTYTGCALLTPSLLGRVPNALEYASASPILHLDIGKGSAANADIQAKLRLAYEFYSRMIKLIGGWDSPPIFIDVVVPDDWDARRNLVLAMRFERYAEKLRGMGSDVGVRVRFIAVARRFLEEERIPEPLMSYDGLAIDANTNTSTGENVKCSREPGKCLKIIERGASIIREALEKRGGGITHLMGPPIRKVLLPLLRSGVDFDTMDGTGWRLDIQQIKWRNGKVYENLINNLILLNKYMTRPPF